MFGLVWNLRPMNEAGLHYGWCFFVGWRNV